MRKVRFTRRYLRNEELRVLFGLDGGGEWDNAPWRYRVNGKRHAVHVWDRDCPEWWDRRAAMAFEWASEAEQKEADRRGLQADVDVRTVVVGYAPTFEPPKGWSVVASQRASYGDGPACPWCNPEGEPDTNDRACQLCSGTGWVASDGYDGLIILRRLRFVA
jgi:hypothetical protein